ncbi:peptidase domain-containing ABC transporter [Flavihumibacter sp. UBA7668]|uniref:peptidase domain-containing ABC transporter n=1 Tax=Flavihumibacter sp. UBA7668 TaxID=1946542 RepID=UPI0025C181AB|nr:cysteine peptidase family C39 domain-containing protein [Flavihumibacter sp. UBA7668]
MKKNRRYPIVRQESTNDCGAACLTSIVAFYGGLIPVELARELCGTQLTGTTLRGLKEGAGKLGFQSEGYRVNQLQELDLSKIPLVLLVKNETGLPHYVVLSEVIRNKTRRNYKIMDPANGESIITENQLKKFWDSGVCIHIYPRKHSIPFRLTNKHKLRWIYEMVDDLLFPFIVILVFGALIAATNGLLTLLVQRIVDSYIPDKAIQQMRTAFILLLSILLGKEMLTRIRMEFILRQTALFNRRLFAWFCSRLLLLPTTYFDKHQIGDFTVRFRDAQKIQQVVFAVFSNVIIDVFFLGVVFVLLFLYEWKIGLIMILVCPFYIIWMAQRANKLSSLQLNLIRRNTWFEQQFISIISSIRVYKLFKKEELANSLMISNQAQFQDAQKKYGSAISSLGLYSGIVIVPVMLLVIYMAALSAISGNLSTGEFVSVIGFVSLLFPILTNLAAFSVPLKEASIAFNRLIEFQLAHANARTQEIEINSYSSICFEHVRPAIHQTKLKEAEMNFVFPATGLISIIGENGSGKTTLLNIICKLNEEYDGVIRINNEFNLRNLSFSSWMNLVAMVPQEITLLAGTIIENIAFEEAYSCPEKILTILNKYGLEGFFKTFPQGLNTNLGEGGLIVSGGQKQLIGLARALYRQPSILLLDEATAALDADTEKWVHNLLLRIKDKMLIVCVSHKNPEFLNCSDLIIRL